jgi:adenylate cyclase, class 2
MIEAELKARVAAPAALRGRLEDLAAGEASTYRDTPGQDLTAAGRELRVRVVEISGTAHAVLTYKEPPADQASQSKLEHETMVASPGVIDVILPALGLRHLVAFDKHCLNFTFAARGRDMLATLVTSPRSTAPSSSWKPQPTSRTCQPRWLTCAPSWGSWAPARST